MLPEENRLRSKKDHDRVYKEGLRYKSPFFLLICAKRKDSTSPSRFSFVISKKVEKTAVKRNRVRRQIREMVRKNLESINDGFDCIIIANKRFVGAKSKAVYPYFTKTFQKARLLE